MLNQNLISELMTKEVITVSEDDTLAKFENYFNARGIHHLVVTNELGAMTGIISNSDVIKVKSWVFNDKVIAKDVMTPNVTSVNICESVKVAIDIFLENRIRALPVLDKFNELCGIITPYDIMKAMK